MTSPNQIRAKYPDSYFFAGRGIHNLARDVDDPELIAAAFGIHALNVASAQAAWEAEHLIASLIFDESGLCIDATYMGKINEAWTTQLKSRFEGRRKFDFGPQGRPAMLWKPDPDGQSHFGGPAPDDFVFPPREHPLNYQYLGFIANSDLPEPVDGGGIHLIHPMLHYDSPIKVYDISDPLAPVPYDGVKVDILDDTKVVSVTVYDGSAEPIYDGYDAYQDGDTLIYERRQVSRQPSDFSTYDATTATHPVWVHAPEIPICPRTGAPMIFLGEIGDGTPSVENDFVRRTRERGKSSAAPVLRFASLEGTFGLYVFYHPVGKTLCILHQI